MVGTALCAFAHPTKLQRLVRFLRSLVLLDIDLGAEVQELLRHLRHALLRGVGIASVGWAKARSAVPTRLFAEAAG